MSDKYRVMIIDDEPDIRSILQISLQQEFEVVSAENGFDALEKLDRFQPDVICSDISMPVMDGLTATKLIRRNPDYAKTPICIISANTTADFMKEAYASGANFFISKPFEPQRVRNTVKAQIEKQKIRPRRKTHSLLQLAELESALFNASHAQQAPPAPAKPAAAKAGTKAVAEPGPAKRQPLKPAAAPAPAAPIAVTAIAMRILVIDDDESVVLNLCNILSKDHEIVPIVDPLEAMEKLVKWEPDVMILSMEMPKLNGLQLANLLRPNPVLAGIEIVFMNNRVTSNIQRSAERFTKNPVMSKTDVFRDIESVLAAIAARPGFRVRPKKTPYKNVAAEFIRELEEAKKKKQQQLQQLYSDQRYTELRSFIGNHFSKK